MRLQPLRSSGPGLMCGAGKVYRQGLRAAAVYGAKCLGMTDTNLQRLRQEAGKALPGSCGVRSLSLQLAMAKADPMFEVLAALPLEWASAVWEGMLQGDHLERTRKRQLPKVKISNQVQGPAGATIMALRKAGWAWPAWDTFKTAHGVDVTPSDKYAHRMSCACFEKDLDQFHWKQWCDQQSERKELAPRPLIEAAIQALRSIGKGQGSHAARKVVLHGSWTQKDLTGIGRADTEVCQACEAEEGTAHHRYYLCQHAALRDLRWQAPDPTWTTVAAASKLHMKWTMGPGSRPLGGMDLRTLGWQRSLGAERAWRPILHRRHLHRWFSHGALHGSTSRLGSGADPGERKRRKRRCHNMQASLGPNTAAAAN